MKPTPEDLVQLLGWRPPGGLLSVYLDLDPGDRGAAWQIELRNGLRTALDAAGSRRREKAAVQAAVSRVEAGLLEGVRPDGRSRIGFVEIGREERELWYSLAVPAGPTTVTHAPRPVLAPLLAALDDGAARGVLAVSSEQVRLLDWALGELEDVGSWELEIYSRDWRDRRSRVPADPARGQGTTASGRDQFGQRLDANRERFLRETGKEAARHAGNQDWGEVDVFADEHHYRLLADGFSDATPLRHLDNTNLVSQPTHAIAERLEAALPELNRERERTLVERVVAEAHGGTRGALGLEETVQALVEGRVDHLLVDLERPYELPEGSPLLEASGGPGLPLGERMLELALSTSAAITPLEGAPADELAAHGGVAALLRY